MRTNTSEVSIFAERINLNGKIFVNGKPLGSGEGLSKVLVVNTSSLSFSTALFEVEICIHVYIYILCVVCVCVFVYNTYMRIL